MGSLPPSDIDTYFEGDGSQENIKEEAPENNPAYTNVYVGNLSHEGLIKRETRFAVGSLTDLLCWFYHKAMGHAIFLLKSLITKDAFGHQP
ncbi:uncharacterized protein LOC142620850 isoform X2 [Castanea sativa]|uniref:uncharacterized protein LOC142620850 isoform X2 n=1 Tax=Castanea sativa TaxID=21020 RepID=UPI003F64D703